MKEIPLTRGGIAYVDDEDFAKLSVNKWRRSTGGYAIRVLYECGRQIMVFMHSEIMGKIEGLEIDHVNGDKLDNQKSNLRHVTHGQNMYNRRQNKKSSSVYKGVSWNERKNRWIAQIGCNGKHEALGNFKNEADAARAYNEAATRLHGEFANINVL